MKEVMIKQVLWKCKRCLMETETDMELLDKMPFSIPPGGAHYCDDGDIGLLEQIGYQIEKREEPEKPIGISWWVNEKTGDDNNDGLTPETPLKTKGEARIRAAANVRTDKIILDG